MATIKCMLCGEDTDIESDDEPRVCLACFACPKCGNGPNSDNGACYVDGMTAFGDEEDSFVRCDRCDCTWTPKKFENAWKRKKAMKPCPHCKGKGFVSSGPNSTT